MMGFLRHNILEIIAIVLSLIALILSLCKKIIKDSNGANGETCTCCDQNKFKVDSSENVRNGIRELDRFVPIDQHYLGEQEREYRENQKRKQLTSIIIVCSTIVSLVSIAAVVGYELFYGKVEGVNEVEIGKVLSMQSITLTITGIAISMIALISTMLTTNREEKFVRMEERLDNQAERITRENEEISQQRKDNREMLEEVSRNVEQITDIVVAQTAFLENTKIEWLKSMTSRSPIYVKYIYLQMIYNKCRKEDISETKQSEYCKTVYEEGSRCLDEYNRGQDEEFGFNRPLEVVLLEIMIADVTLTMARKAKMENEDKYKYTIAKFDEAERRFMNILDKYKYPDDDGYVNNGLGLVQYWKYMCEKRYSGKVEEDLLKKALEFYKKAIAFGNKYEFYGNVGVVYSQKLKLRIAEKYEALKKAYNAKVGDTSEDLPSILMYEEVAEDFGGGDYKAKKEECEEILKESEKCYLEAKKISPMAVTPWINLAGVCIDRIRQLMRLDEECVILRSVFLMNDTTKKEYMIELKDGKIEKLYNQAKSYLERAQDNNPFKIDCYFKMAQLKSYYILYLLLDGTGKTEVQALKEEIEENFARCEEIDKECGSVKYIKRMYYDVIGEYGKAKEVDENIAKGGKSNWNGALDIYLNIIKAKSERGQIQ